MICIVRYIMRDIAVGSVVIVLVMIVRDLSLRTVSPWLQCCGRIASKVRIVA
jgi:hypothetical protein